MTKEEVERVILLVFDALNGVRVVSTDQNRLGWRDILGGAAAEINRASHRSINDYKVQS